MEHFNLTENVKTITLYEMWTRQTQGEIFTFRGIEYGPITFDGTKYRFSFLSITDHFVLATMEGNSDSILKID